MDLRKGVTLGLSVAGIAIGALFGVVSDSSPLPAPPPPATVPEPAEVGSTGPLVVHVSGWVLAPGVVEIPEGALIVDAIAAAGGALTGARLDLINLASPVAGGDHIEIPGPEAHDPGPDTQTTGDGRISLNGADASTLQTLPGVGPVLAERIVAHREASGPFATVEDLLDVSGIGEAKLAAIRDLVVVR